VPQTALGKGSVTVTWRRSLPSVTLGKAFAECKIAFAVCLRHTAKELIPVVNMYGEVTVCQVHDTILDFIISKSKEENFVTIFSDGYQMPGPQRKVCRLSLHYSSSVENMSQLKDLDLSHLRSVAMFSYAADAPSIVPELQFIEE
jgi:hypothetical protein